MTIAILLTLLAPSAHAQTLTLSGTCAGEVTATVDGLTPGGRFALVSGLYGGDHEVPAGACAGVEFDLRGLHPVAAATAGRDGRVTASPRLGCRACESTLQVIDLTTCTVSGAVHVPGSCEDDHSLAIYPTDYDTLEPLVGAAVTLGDDHYVTDADGRALLALEPEAPVQYVIEAPGYPAHRIESLGTVNIGQTTPAMLSHATIDMLGLLLGIPVDPDRAIVVVNVYEYDPGDSFLSVEGVRVSLSVPYDVALAADAASPFGLSPGDTTLPGSSASVSFANVATGTARVGLELPDGYDCRWQKTLELRPGEVTSLNAVCNEPR